MDYVLRAVVASGGLWKQTLQALLQPSSRVNDETHYSNYGVGPRNFVGGEVQRMYRGRLCGDELGKSIQTSIIDGVAAEINLLHMDVEFLQERAEAIDASDSQEVVP